jgi:ferredoxin
VKVTVDFDLCASTGNCVRTISEVFEIRDDGYLYVLGGFDESLPERLRDKVQSAVDMCPSGAIRIDE